MAITPDVATAVTNGSAPAPAPTDNAPAQAQAPATAPAQAATASAPAQAPAQGTTPTPSTTQSGLPGAPTADPAAVATAHPTSILRGALFGILGAVSKVGHAVGSELKTINAGGHVAQANTKIAQQGEIAKQQQEAQAAKDAQQKAADEHIKSGVDNAEAIARTNYSSNLAAGAAINNSINRENLSQTQRENIEKNNAADAEWIQALKDEGVPLKQEHGPGFDNLGPSHATDVVNGSTTLINNGQTGPDHGVAILPVDQAKQTPLQHDRQVITDWKVDPKTGAKTPVYSTFTAGNDTVYTAHVGYMEGLKRGAEADKVADAIQKNNLNQAEVKNKQGEASKFEGEAENQRAQARTFGGAVTPQNQNLTGEDFISTLPPQEQSIVRSAGQYNLDSKDLPRGKEKLPFIEAITHAYPNWSEAKYNERYSYLKEYGSSTKGDGATRSRLNTSIGHLDYLSQANDALNQNNLPALAAIANKIGVVAGRTPKITYDAIAEKAAGEIAGAIKGGGAAPTDPEIASARKSFSSDQGAAQRKANIDAQWGLLDTQVGTIHDGFTNKMGQSPEQYGQPVLFGNSQQILDKHLGRGGAQISVGGQSYPLNPNGTFTHGGYLYKPSADGKTATLVGPAK